MVEVIQLRIQNQGLGKKKEKEEKNWMLDYEKHVRVLCDWNSGGWVMLWKTFLQMKGLQNQKKQYGILTCYDAENTTTIPDTYSLSEMPIVEAKIIM